MSVRGTVGQQFVNQLSKLTGADVAASDDLTGDAAQGGDWEFEVETGGIEAALAFDEVTRSSYEHTLNTLEITNDGALDTDGHVSVNWGGTISSGALSSISIIDFSEVTSDLTFKVLPTGNVEVTRQSLSATKKITIGFKDNITFIGPKPSSKKTELNLSAIQSNTAVKITSKDIVEVIFNGRELNFKKIDDVTGSNGEFNTYEVESNGNIKGSLIAKGNENILQYSGGKPAEVLLR